MLGEQLARTAGAGRGPASQQVLPGSPARVILDRAREVEADLLVLGPHRPRPFGTFGLGTTADRVIRAATAPCLIVRGELSLPLRRLLVPLDLSDPSRGALDLALSWAVRLEDPARASVVPEAEVTVAHVIPLVFDTETFSVDREVLQPELAREIQGAIVRTEAATHVSIREEIVWGDLPADEIVRLAEEERADLVVLATHGHGPVLRALSAAWPRTWRGVPLAPCSWSPPHGGTRMSRAWMRGRRWRGRSRRPCRLPERSM